MKLPRQRHRFEIRLEDEAGQTMAEYSVVLTLILILIGMGAFAALAVAIISQLDRVTGLLG
jgi:Flp pilus assembly pilin Flp